MIYPLDEAKKEIINSLKEVLTLLKLDYDIKLEIPPEENMGDFAFPCFPLASIAKKSPLEIAKDISVKIKKSKCINYIEVNSGYVNFYINEKFLSNSTLDLISKNEDFYGHLDKKNKKVIIEHTSANPNGPLHVGRARNPIIGDTLVRLFKAAGYDVESQFYLDDMGKQVAMLAWGVNNLDSKEIPKSEYNKSDHKKVGFYQTTSKLMKEDDNIAFEIGEIMEIDYNTVSQSRRKFYLRLISF